VVRDGRLYPREDLDARLARYRAHFDAALYDAIVTPIIRRLRPDGAPAVDVGVRRRG